MSGINSLLNIGNSALSAHQTAISVTGNNIANVDTDGYSKQNVRFEARPGIDKWAGQLGQGVNATDIYRSFNRFVEDAYLSRNAMFSRWSEQSGLLQNVQSLFNESNTSGMNSALGSFFGDWTSLTMRPNDEATRESLVANADNLIKLVTSTKISLEDAQREMDMYIEQSVREANELIEGIAQVNKQIDASTVKKLSNVNQLLDQRDQLVRKLSEIMDISVIDHGRGNFSVSTVSGLPLVNGNVTYSLQVQGGQVENGLTTNSTYKGSMSYEGKDSHEYTFEIVSPPKADGTDGSMRVSFDGGKTWLKDDDGSELHVPIPTDKDEKIQINALSLQFDADTTQLVKGDRFTVTPKTGLYWVEPTRDPLNITPLVMDDGSDAGGRLSGGKLAAYFNVRDENLGKLIDKLDAFANSLIWEVNSLHSQGAGNKTMTHTVGSYEVPDHDMALGRSGSGLAYFDRLTEGNVTFQIYNEDGTPAEQVTLDFDPNTDGIQNFDPSRHSLKDVVEAINNTGKLTANIEDNKLQLMTSEAGTSFAVVDDTSGLLAALGINTMFNGSDASTMALKPDVVQDINYINAAKVNADGTIKEGDNETAKLIAQLADKAVNIATLWEHNKQSLSEYLAGTSTFIGAQTRTAIFNENYNKALFNDVSEQSASISGVNLDEEMTNLIKFQHSYTAAAKLITTADQMLQTLLSLKQ